MQLETVQFISTIYLQTISNLNFPVSPRSIACVITSFPGKGIAAIGVLGSCNKIMIQKNYSIYLLPIRQAVGLLFNTTV